MAEPLGPTDDSVPTDSAGIPWAGRRLESNAAAADDGSAPLALIEVLERFHRGGASVSEVVDVIRESRLLIPLVAEVDPAGGHKRADLSIVTVAGPDGRNVLPIFSSAAAMRRWNPTARPVPVDAIRVALAAVDDHTDLAVLDPTSPTEFAIRRPALWSIARQRAWIPGYADPSVRAAFADSVRSETDVVALDLSPGDPTARLTAPELTVAVTLRTGLDDLSIGALTQRLQSRWALSDIVAERVDSLTIRLIAAM